MLVERQGCNPPLPDQSHHRPAMDIITRKQAQEQGLKHYFNGKPCKRGHLSPRYLSTGGCTRCTIERAAKYAEANPDKVAASKRKHQKSNPVSKEIQRARNAAYYAANREREQERTRNYAQTHRDVVNANKTRHRREKTDSYIADRLRIRLHQVLTQAKGVKSASLRELTGCDIPEFRAHIERQFTDGMSWDNYGEWHLDHIRPCASFSLSNPEHQKACFNWRNYQPLGGVENVSKHAEWTPAMESEWARRMVELGWDGDLFLVFEQELAA